MEMAAKAINSFFESIEGEPDIYKQILLEEFFKFLLIDEETCENIVTLEEKE